MTMLDALRTLYEREWPTLQAGFGERQDLSSPFLVDPDAGGYPDSKVRLLVVGQETRGWFDPIGSVGIDRLLEAYAETKATYQGPLLQVARRLCRGFNNCDDAFAWTNAFKVDQVYRDPESVNPRYDHPDAEVREKLRSLFNVLSEEIRILCPDVVVFFTGPTLDDWLENLLGTLKFQKCHGQWNERRFARVVQDGNARPVLPKHSYRTYHPDFPGGKGYPTVTERIDHVMSLVNEGRV